MEIAGEMIITNDGRHDLSIFYWARIEINMSRMDLEWVKNMR